MSQLESLIISKKQDNSLKELKIQLEISVYSAVKMVKISVNYMTLLVVRYTRNCTFIHHASSDVIGSQRDESQSHCSMHDAYVPFPVYLTTLDSIH